MADDRIEIEIVLDDGSVRKGLGRVKKEAKSTADSIGRSFDKSIGRLKTNIASLGAAFAGIAVGVSIREFAQFEKGLIGVGKTADISGDRLKELGDEFLTLSKRLPVASEELLEIGVVAGQLGIKGADNIIKFTETVAKLNAATADFKGEFAATTLARLLNITKESIDGVEELASVFVTLGNDIEATEGEIASISTEIARSSARFGLASKEVVAIGAALKSVGVASESGGSAIGRTFSTIAAAVAKGEKRLELFSKITGQTTKDLKKNFQDDALGVFQAFIKGLGAVSKDSILLTQTLASLGLNQERVSKTIVPLAQNYDALQRSLALANNETEKAEALNKEASAAFDSLGSDATKALNSLKALGIEMISAFVPAIRATLNGLAFLSDAITNVFAKAGRTSAQKLADLKERLKTLNDELAESGKGWMSFGRVQGFIKADIIATQIAIDQVTESIKASKDAASDTGSGSSPLASIAKATEEDAMKTLDAVRNMGNTLKTQALSIVTQAESQITPLQAALNKRLGLLKEAREAELISQEQFNMASAELRRQFVVQQKSLASFDELEAKEKESLLRREEDQKASFQRQKDNLRSKVENIRQSLLTEEQARVESFERQLLTLESARRNEILSDQVAAEQRRLIQENFNQQTEQSQAFSLAAQKKGFNDFARSLEARAKRLSATIVQGFGNALAGGFEAFGRALANGENAFDSFEKAFLSVIGNLAIQVGTFFILIGTAQVLSGINVAGGLLAIGAGAALTVFGGFLSAKASPSSPSLGGSSGSSLDGIGGSPIVPEEDEIEEEESAPRRPNTNVTLEVRGDLIGINGRETARHLADLLNENFDTDGSQVLVG